MSNGGYRRAGLRLSLDIVGQGRGHGRKQSHPDPQEPGTEKGITSLMSAQDVALTLEGRKKIKENDSIIF